jgi:hypothetical protein
MQNCTLHDSKLNHKAIFKNTNDGLMDIDLYENDSVVKSFILVDYQTAKSLKDYLLKNTNSKELPYNGVNVTIKGKI